MVLSFCRWGMVPHDKREETAMTAKEFKKVFALAQREDFDPSLYNTNILNGCALSHFERVSVTIEIAAAFLRWHAICMDCSWDMYAVNEMEYIYKRKVNLI